MTLWQQPSNRLEFLEKNLKPIVSGARVLDFCCGTGMNGLYALEHGAKHVTFTDVRQRTFTDWIDTHAVAQGYNVDYIKSNNYVWKFFDANELQKSQQLIDLQNFDIIIYHGHFYHARNHFDIVKMLSDSSAKHIIFETKAVNNDDNIQIGRDSFGHSTPSSGISGIIQVHSPQTTNNYKSMHYDLKSADNDGYTLFCSQGSGAFKADETTTVEGFSLTCSTNGFTSGRIDIYGVKQV